MNIGIYYNDDNSQSVSAIEEFKRLLNEEKIHFIDLEETSPIDKKEINADLIVVFGGDGSVLTASKITLDKIPLVAINTGTIGFLTSYEINQLSSLVEAIKTNTLEFSERRLLSIEYNGSTCYALNDAVIMKDFQKDNYSCCIKLNLTIDGKRVDKYLADGLILSTPTGSTAYALSAGAPVVTPDLEAIVVAPICAHSLQSRPIVFSPKSTAEVTVDEKSRPCALYVDGAPIRTLNGGETLTINLSNKIVKICDNHCNFFEKLGKKISSWSNNG